MPASLAIPPAARIDWCLTGHRLALWFFLPFALAACATAVAPSDSAPTATAIEPANGCELLGGEAPESTFVLFDPANGRWRGCNAVAAFARRLPASTFKVPHALIALETGVVDDPSANGAGNRVARG